MREIIKPHRVKSREVKEEDIPRVIYDANEMFKHVSGKCVALAHSQITDQDPLRFFVNKEGEIIINPKITRHVNYFVDSIEGCMTFPDNGEIKKSRYRKIDVSFQTIENGKLGPIHEAEVRNLTAFIFQHEIDHMDGIYCFD